MAKNKSERRQADEREERNARVDEIVGRERHHRDQATAAKRRARKAKSDALRLKRDETDRA